MSNYQLVGVDQMEATKLRRKLDPIDPWDNAKSERVKPVIAEIGKTCTGGIVPTAPRWEHGVYPLYYFYRQDSRESLRMIYEKIGNDYGRLFPECNGNCLPNELSELISYIANTEGDLLIEDVEYFIFVEAKNPPDGKLPKFEMKRGVHQLVWIYAEGPFLSRKIKKQFALATLGTKMTSYDLTPAEQTLLAIFGDKRKKLTFCDLSWDTP